MSPANAGAVSQDPRRGQRSLGNSQGMGPPHTAQGEDLPAARSLEWGLQVGTQPVDIVLSASQDPEQRTRLMEGAPAAVT